VQDIDVWVLPAVPREPVKQVACLEQRRIERLAVEADQRPGLRELARHGAEHRPLVGIARQQELPRDERGVVVEPAAADEKGLGPGAAAQTRGLEIEEHEGRARVGATGVQRSLRGRFVEAFRERAHRLAPVTRRRFRPPFDNKAAVAPDAAERGQIQGLGTTDRGLRIADCGLVRDWCMGIGCTNNTADAIGEGAQNG